jgi:DNA-binding transcriptional ArsR family regulator
MVVFSCFSVCEHAGKCRVSPTVPPTAVTRTYVTVAALFRVSFIINIKVEVRGQKMVRNHGGTGDRQDREVPIQLPYPADAPERVARALRALSAPTRVVTLRHLLSHDSATPAEIIESTAATAVHPALIELERLGFVTGDIPAGARQGKAVRYSLNRAELSACLDELRAWMVPAAD